MTVTAQIGAAIEAAAVDVADMAERVLLNGPEVTYAAEKLGHALYKAAEALALCGVDAEKVGLRAAAGYQHGLWLRDPGEV